uniref:Mediator of RNA polymerase II transcription subunit 22 n=1 Tax=Sus scrofa TaxID=9823 RepID=A0A4X1T295_PIG
MAQQRALPQSKETLLQSYNKRLKDDVKSIMDNFTEIIKTAKIEDETQVSRATQGEQDNYEMHVRAANIVRAGESLMKLVSDLKQFLILNDFPSVNEAVDQRNQQLRALQEECDRKLIALRDEVSIDLYELEEEYYSSSRDQLWTTLGLLVSVGKQPLGSAWTVLGSSSASTHQGSGQEERCQCEVMAAFPLPRKSCLGSTKALIFGECVENCCHCTSRGPGTCPSSQ